MSAKIRYFNGIKGICEFCLKGATCSTCYPAEAASIQYGPKPRFLCRACMADEGFMTVTESMLYERIALHGPAKQRDLMGTELSAIVSLLDRQLVRRCDASAMPVEGNRAYVAYVTVRPVAFEAASD